MSDHIKGSPFGEHVEDSGHRMMADRLIAELAEPTDGEAIEALLDGGGVREVMVYRCAVADCDWVRRFDPAKVLTDGVQAAKDFDVHERAEHMPHGAAYTGGLEVDDD